MDFLEVLDQVVDQLRRRRRLTYRTIKLQFNLDDEYLDALKDELIKGQRLAADEDGEVLVWTGETEGALVETPTSTPPAQPEVTKEVQPLCLLRYARIASHGYFQRRFSQQLHRAKLGGDRHHVGPSHRFEP